MARESNSNIIAATESSELQPFHAIELQFHNPSTNTDVPLYFWSGLGNIVHDGKTWAGVGTFLNVSDIEEAAELKATGITVSLSGIESTTIEKALLHEFTGRVGKVYFGIVGNSVWDEVFSGYIDTMNIDDSPTSSTISVTIENRLIDLERVNPVRYTVESHQTISVDDTYFSYTASLQDQQPEWGPKE